MAAAGRVGLRNNPWIAQRSGGWSAPSFIARCAFFVLGVAACGLTAGVLEILSRGAALLTAGVTLLIAAEWLILRKRLFHAGVEEALWTGGLLMLAMYFVPSSGERVISITAALVLAIAALRLLNPFLLTLAFAAAAPAVRAGTGLASGIFALAALIAGIRRRSHAPLLACMASLGCVAYQLRDLTALPLRLKLIVLGSAALFAALGLNRYLRTARRGITSLQLAKGSAALELAQWIGAGALAPRAAAQADAPFKGGGGSGGGGGADGSY
jgi:hypothetical protein